MPKPAQCVGKDRGAVVAAGLQGVLGVSEDEAYVVGAFSESGRDAQAAAEEVAARGIMVEVVRLR